MVDRRVGALQGEHRWEGSRERVSAPGSESIALGHALVCPGVSLGGDKLGGLPAWGPLGLNLLSGCRVCAQSYQQRSVSAQETHTHTHACTQAIHMQDSCTLALLCSGPPVGVGRASLRRLWKGKLPLECPDARRRRRRRMRSTATEPEVAARDKPPEVPPCKD